MSTMDHQNSNRYYGMCTYPGYSTITVDGHRKGMSYSCKFVHVDDKLNNNCYKSM